MPRVTFTRAFLRREIADVQSYIQNRTESPVYSVWCGLVDQWFQDGSSTYYWEGFKGFMERTVDEIIEDFEINDLING